MPKVHISPFFCSGNFTESFQSIARCLWSVETHILSEILARMGREMEERGGRREEELESCPEMQENERLLRQVNRTWILTTAQCLIV